MFDQPPTNLPTVPGAAPAEPPHSASPMAQAPIVPAPVAAPVKPAEPEDMFAGVEPVSTPQRSVGLGTMPPSSSHLGMPPEEMHRGGGVRKMILALVAVVVVGGVGYGVYAYWDQLLPSTPEAALTTTSEPTTIDRTSTEVPTTTIEQLPAAPTDSTLDTDGDTVTDAKEAELGINPNSPDTDGDELYDGDEVNLFRTNPLQSDTDADGYSDGAEVKAGYNPNGAGRLFNVPNP